MFKVGQKVVYIGGASNKNFKAPQLNEIVTIRCKCYFHKEHYDLEEYPYDVNGRLQSCEAKLLRPLDHAFGEQLATELEQEINEELLIES